MKLKLKRSRGFTLVELLVVISIIALLASVALPVFNSAQMNAKITTASLNASGIFKALLLYANDYDGQFPASDNTANEAYRQLFPDYLEDEKVFFVASSAWHNSAPGKRPDGDIGTKPDYAQALERGENHWAYHSGLNNTTSTKIPIIADGFTDTIGEYTDVTTKKGGVWKGTKAIIVYVGGAAEQVNLSARDNFRPMVTKGGQKVELFSSNYDEVIETSNVKNPME